MFEIEDPIIYLASLAVIAAVGAITSFYFKHEKKLKSLKKAVSYQDNLTKKRIDAVRLLERELEDNLASYLKEGYGYQSLIDVQHFADLLYRYWFNRHTNIFDDTYRETQVKIIRIHNGIFDYELSKRLKTYRV